MTKPRQGWRLFRCEDEEYGCGTVFLEATRDAESPSLTICPRCNEEVLDRQGWTLDPRIPVDKFANLLKEDVRIIE